MNSIKRHLIYLDLLYNCLSLSEQDARHLARRYGMGGALTGKDCEELSEDTIRLYRESAQALSKPYGHFASVNHSELYFQGIRSIPSDTAKLIICNELSKTYDLHGVAGFYLSGNRWRLNLHGQGILKPYRDEHNRITGLFVYRNINSQPTLLSSANLYKGTPAIQPLEQEEREVA
jgi:hypothetical protein